MKIVVVHNYYQQLGGEDRVFTAETSLLEAKGHQVVRYTIHNDAIANMDSLQLARATVWNQEIYRELRQLLRQEKPQLVHFHNSFPLISPSAYHAVRAEGLPIVQTLHNYRLLCPSAVLFRQGQVCEDCLGNFVPWSGIVHACYRDNRAATGMVSAMLTLHRGLKTWTETVDLYIALSEFSRQKFVQGGLPADKILVKPNFVYPNLDTGKGSGEYALFVGRLAPEKGVETLLAAWEKLPVNYRLKIVGDGPLQKRAIQATTRMPEVEWLGWRAAEEVDELMGAAKILIFPSQWYETFGRVVVEAFAKGTPVLAADIGGVAELVESGRTGLRFRPGDAEDLALKVKWCWNHPTELAQMRQNARIEYETKYTADRNYQMLMSIYHQSVRMRNHQALTKTFGRLTKIPV
jgi:glycosyltransferase involved in cell wall biosynthesis